MRTPDAVRQRKSRAHRQGIHTLCDPTACDGYTPPVIETPLRLGPRGRRLKRELLTLSDLEPGDAILIEEAARLADRLDVLARILNGEDHAWLAIQIDLRKNLLGEARQQALALRQIVSMLQDRKAVRPAESPKASIIDELSRRRADRLSDTASG